VSLYIDLLAHCRYGLLQPVIRKHLEALVKQHGAIGMTRIASVYLVRVCASEISLPGHAWRLSNLFDQRMRFAAQDDASLHCQHQRPRHALPDC
jgi:hypothetical protein